MSDYPFQHVRTTDFWRRYPEGIAVEMRPVTLSEMLGRHFTRRRRYLLRVRRKRHDFANGRPERRVG